MKIYVAHASSFDYAKELYEPLKRNQFYKTHDFIFPHESTEQNSKLLIQQSDLVLAEVSYPSTGSGIELGWADAFNIPILGIHRINKQVSSSLKYITDQFIVYEHSNDLIFKLEQWLNK